MDHAALLAKEVRRERQRPEAWVVARAVVWISEQGGMRKRRRASTTSGARRRG